MFLLLGICFKSFLVFQAGQNGPLIKVTWNENGKLKDLMVIIYAVVKFSFKFQSIEIDLDFDFATFVLYFCLVFNLQGSFGTVHFFQMLYHFFLIFYWKQVIRELSSRLRCSNQNWKAPVSNPNSRLAILRNPTSLRS